MHFFHSFFTQTHLITVSVQEAINLEGLVSQKEKFVTLLLIDMIKLTTVPIFQNLKMKYMKTKIVPKVKTFDNLLILI